jgi:penicillin-binding protein 2
VGLAPRRNPEIVVAVLYQSGEHGYLAAPLARDVIKTYFDKRDGKQPLTVSPSEPAEKVAATPPTASGRMPAG